MDSSGNPALQVIRIIEVEQEDEDDDDGGE